MPRSWAHPAVTGYEIKVSRRDFVQDKKLSEYLPYCNYLYIVAPKDVLETRELPEGVGFLQVTQNRAITKVKASYRDVEIPQSIFRYVLMCRTKITQEYMQEHGNAEYNRQFWNKWLEEKHLDSDLGYKVSTALRKTIEKKIESVESENRVLRRKVEELQPVSDMLQKLGIPSWNAAEQIEKRWNNGTGAHNEKIRELAREMAELLTQIKWEAR
jgi:hypothetical protein